MEITTVILIDDEPQARKLLTTLLKDACPNVQVLADCDDLPNGVKAIRKLKPQLVLLDIEMPGHSGLELLDFFNEDEINFGIIFTTAYNQYAIQAFKLSAIDYLLKPLSEEDVAAAVLRFQKINAEQQKSQYTLLKDNLQQHTAKKIAVPVGQSIRFIELDKIMLLKADNTYTEILLIGGEKIVVSRTLKNFEDTLPADCSLLRVHKSYIVNKQFIAEYVKSDGGYLLLENKMEIPVSSDRVNQITTLYTIIKR